MPGTDGTHSSGCGHYVRRGKSVCDHCASGAVPPVAAGTAVQSVLFEGRVRAEGTGTDILSQHTKFADAGLTPPVATPVRDAVIQRLAEGQAPLVMTPREIRENFAPLDGDRLYWYEDGRGSPDHDETDEEFWARKLRESRGDRRRHKLPPWDQTGTQPVPPAPSRERPGFDHPVDDTPGYPNEGHATLFDALAADGVTNPVSLQFLPEERAEGRRQVLGGNHRVAAMSELAPDEPIPVAFFDRLRDAKDSLGESY